MAEVRLNVYLKDRNSDEFKQVLAQINPNCPDEKLTELVTALNSLTTNQVKEVWKVVEKYLEDDDFVSVEEVRKILRGEYVPVEVDDPITRDDVQLILTGNYTPEPDSDTWSADDFIF